MLKIENRSPLTVYPTGSFQEFLVIALPLILIALSESLVKFTDRLCLSRYSVEALEANSCTLSLCNLFQLPLLRIISITQAMIASYKASNQFHKIGSCVWQMIWLSLLSGILTLFAIPYATTFFLSTAPFKEITIPYFYTLIPLNFLMPLTAALSSFYIGRGESKRVLYLTLMSHAAFFLLDPICIFGTFRYFPALGLQGAAIAKIASQLLLCALLFRQFLNRKNRLLYHTGSYKLNLLLLWKCLQIGVPRSLSRIMLLFQWAAVVRFLSLQGPNYLLALSFGESIHFFFLFIVDGMSQAVISIGAYIAAIEKKHLIQKFQKTAIIFIALCSALLVIPYLFFADSLIHLMIPYPLAPEAYLILKQCCIWSLLFFITQSLNSLAHNLLTAFYDTFFQLWYNLFFSWIAMYLLFIFAVDYGLCPPGKIWLIASLSLMIPTTVYFIRMRRFTHPKPAPTVSHIG